MTIRDQPPPTPASGDIWQLVIDEMIERRRVGIERYGTPLQVNNGRDALVDAYQEVLDMAVYLRQEIEERREEIKAIMDAERKEQARLIRERDEARKELAAMRELYETCPCGAELERMTERALCPRCAGIGIGEKR